MLCVLPTSLWSPLSSLHFHLVESSGNPLFPLKSSFFCLVLHVFLPGELPCWGDTLGCSSSGILWYAWKPFLWPQCRISSPSICCLALVCMPPSLMACCLLPSALGDPNCVSLVFMFPLNLLLLRNDNYTCLIHHWHPSAILTPASFVIE